MKSLTQSINEGLEIFENELEDIFGGNPLKKGSKEVVDVLVDGKPALAINHIFTSWSDSTADDIKQWMEATRNKDAMDCSFEEDDWEDIFYDEYDEIPDEFVVYWGKDGVLYPVPYDKQYVRVR